MTGRLVNTDCDIQTDVGTLRVKYIKTQSVWCVTKIKVFVWLAHEHLKSYYLNFKPADIIIEPHGRGVPEALLNDRSSRPGLPECGRSPYEGRPGRGERSLIMAEGTPFREVLFLLYPFTP